MDRRIPLILRIAPLCLVMAGIFYVSHQPGSAIHLPDFYSADKVLHAIAYATLGGTFLLALQPYWRTRFPLVAAATLGFCLVYGVLDEYHQSFIPGRSVSGGDVAADFCGGLLVVLLLLGWCRISQPSKDNLNHGFRGKRRRR